MLPFDIILVLSLTANQNVTEELCFEFHFIIFTCASFNLSSKTVRGFSGFFSKFNKEGTSYGLR